MTKDQNDRIVVAFELIAKSLGGLHEEAARAGKRYWPAAGQQREAVLSHVPNEEDEARRNLGITDEPINKWLEPDWLDEADTDAIGERSRQWLQDHPPQEAKKPDARAEVAAEGQKGGTGIKEVKSKA
jgi:hypothetical protein